jgi:hypothetical protein
MVLAQLEKRITFAVTHLLEIENIFVKLDRLFDVVHLDGDMIASVNLHAHAPA